MAEILPFLIWPFLASLILTGIHAYLGVHVVERGVIFVDLALAQIAALGANFVWDNGAHYAILHALGMDVSGLTAGPTTPDLEWPTWVIYLAIPLGSALMCFRFVQVAWTFRRTGHLPHVDHSHVEGLDEVTPQDVAPRTA